MNRLNRLLSILLVSLLQITSSYALAYQLTVEATPHGSGQTNSGGGNYEAGARINLNTSKNQGFVFQGWFDGDELISSATSITYVMPERDAHLYAKYKFDPSNPANPAMPDTTTYYSFKATVSPEGAGTLNLYQGSYAKGKEVQLKANYNQGFKFLGWYDEEGKELSTNASYKFIMPAKDCSLTAHYGYDPSNPNGPEVLPINYTVYVQCKPLGSGTFNNTVFTRGEGTRVDINAYTNTGFRFVRWEDEEGNELEKNQKLEYVIPGRDSNVYGVFVYDPSNPNNPNKNHWNKELGELILDDFTTGNLNSAASAAISGSSANDVTMITVAGRINNNDIGIANNYKNCTLLDLSRVTGITEIPSYAFDKTSLESVYLPASIEKIGDRAFEDCKQLSSLTIYAMTPPTLGNNVFRGVPEGLIVYVPATSLSQYQDAAGWKDFTILPIQEDIRSITISFPEGFKADDFKGMWLELTNTKNGQRMHYVLTERHQYTFSNIISNTTWNAQLRNQSGDVFGQIRDIEVKDKDVAVTFDSLTKPQTLTLSVLTPEPEALDVTEKVQVTWVDAEGNYLAQNISIGNLCPGKTVAYSIVLPQELAVEYNAPKPTTLTIAESSEENKVVCYLDAIHYANLSGKVTDSSSHKGLSGAVVTASQTFAGKYSKTLTTRTDAEGNFKLPVLRVPTTLSVSSSDYVSQNIVCAEVENTENDQLEIKEIKLDDIALKPITGATISLSFTYRPSVLESELSQTQAQDWYNDYKNVQYQIFNRTKSRDIKAFNVQYPSIVLLEEVDPEDELELTASSLTSAFMPVKAPATIDSELHAAAKFDIVELGSIKASFDKSENTSVVGSLYDNKGKLVKSYDYDNSKSELTIANLMDGDFTLLTMGESTFFNNVYDLEGISQTGLVEGKDYVKSPVKVKSGVISLVEIEEVPLFDESRFYYTDDNTSFTANKTSIVSGNYLTLTAHIDFKKAYVASVKDLNLIVDLPESCQFVENSVMVGNNVSGYNLDGYRLTIPMRYVTDRVRFCVIPTVGGEYSPSAMAAFTLNDQQIVQPIGNASFTVKDLEIKVPSVVAQPKFTVSGAASANAKVEIYEDGILVGVTTTKPNGMWSADIEFVDQTNLRNHEIYAKVTRKDGLELQTEKQICQYDKNAIQVSKVTMINTAHPAANLNTCEYVTEFDFINPKTSIPSYWYWPSYPQFTFLVEFTNNDPEVIYNVDLFVFTTSGKVDCLRPTFDDKLEKWVIVKDYHSNSLPVNVSVAFDAIKTIDDSVVKSYIDLAQTQEDISEIELQDYTSSSEMDFNGLFNFEQSEIDLDVNLEPVSQIPASALESGNSFEVEGKTIYVIDENLTQSSIDLYFNAEYLQSLYPSDEEMPQDLSILNSISTPYVKVSLGIKDTEIPNLDNLNESEHALSMKAPNGPTLPGTSFYAVMTYRSFFNFSRDAQEHYQQLVRLYERIRALDCLDDGMKVYLYADIETLWQQYFNIQLTATLLGRSRARITSPLYAVNFSGSILNFGAKIGFALRCLDIDRFLRYYEIACPPPKDPPTPPNPDVKPVMDPSGYVYEAVSSNRVEGVTATAFYKEMVEDMYGDLRENVVKWDAEEYAQENPLFTDEYGMYAWDVPQGLWQVKFEKEGYETTYSEWLPVPPPQLEVNIAIKQNIQPNVKAAHAYEDAVELEFDKYMIPSLLTTENIIVQADGKTVEGTVELLDEEAASEGEGVEETFASRIRFNATEPFSASEISLRVSNRVKSYAGIRMQDDYMQTFSVERELSEIVCDSTVTINYGDALVLPISVVPAEAASGKKLLARSSSSLIISIGEEELEIDEDGMAYLTISGELPGTAVLTFTVEDTTLKGSSVVNVISVKEEIVQNPVASIASGTTVEEGTYLYLYCSTEGATIYYTTDGSCPCEFETANIYDGPIVLTEDVTIKAIAVKDGMTDSEVVEFTYIVEVGGMELITNDNALYMYPLPLKEELNISCSGKTITYVSIVNLNGTTLLSEAKPSTEVQMDVTSLRPGIYLVNVITRDNSYHRKVLKID